LCRQYVLTSHAKFRDNADYASIFSYGHSDGQAVSILQSRARLEQESTDTQFPSAGHRAITTCSPKNFELVKSYGADAVFDYNSPTLVEDIKALTRNCLKYTLDPFGEIKTLMVCHEAMGRTGGRYTALESFQKGLIEKKTIKRDLVMGATIHGKGVQVEGEYGKPPSEEERAKGIEVYQSVQRLVDARRLRVHPLRVLNAGFEGIMEGLKMLDQKIIHGEKVVVKL
jgi:NADPH:quinone reductase-like Zn-dependent oxidoreductase